MNVFVLKVSLSVYQGHSDQESLYLCRTVSGPVCQAFITPASLIIFTVAALEMREEPPADGMGTPLRVDGGK